MPWELPSVLSRLRRPARHQHAQEQPSQDPILQIQQENSLEQLPIDRRILQDPSSFLDETQDDLPHGLTPSTRLPSARVGGNTRYRPKPIDSTLEPLSEGSDLTPDPSVDISPPTQPKFSISRISRIASGGEWSTFGRKRERTVPEVSGPVRHTTPLDGLQQTSRSESPSPTRHSKHPSVDSTRSTFTLSRLTHPTSRPSSGTHERLSSPSIRSPRQSPDIRISSSKRSSSPTNTMSSQRHPRTPPSQPSYIAAVSTHVTPAVTNLTTPIQREVDLDSPHTFGRPTPPPDNSPFAHSSPPPPLPPLDHPELAAALSSRRQSMSTDQPTLSAFRDRSNTLPTNRRTQRKDVLSGSLSFKLGHSVRHRLSLPHARRNSINATTGQLETQPPDGSERTRTASGDGRQRRTSADWSSYQATVGVNSHANQAWPAEVSREILRLSLGPGPDLTSGSSLKRNSKTQGKSADPMRRPNRGAVSRSFLPFPHPARPDSPPTLAASATLIDGREPAPSRPRSLQLSQGNNRGSQQPARSTMAEVKRSASVVESRNTPNNGTSGVTSASSALSKTDPGRPLAEAPQASHSLLPSFALTPSRSLLSGHVPPSNLNTPTSSMQAEPSTPTPEPRHQSDKSRGKRKAEENIDLTPPEQKKEGQRATFLLPTEPRSQRISNSSHAPSSYHRKRARLSTTSPFATPVQSRPASVLETPQSARNQRFASLSSATGARIASSPTPSRAASTHSRQPHTPTSRKHERHQSMSQVSIPLSAFVSPHAPSISRSSKFHMRDPRRPPKKPNDTPWGLRFATEDEPGSPIQAWCFFIGFLLFPVWWIAALFLRVPTTRIAGDVDAEKGVTIDDPQIEHDAKSWRFRCRVMAVVSLFTYIPFIVLVAIFAPR